MRLNITILLVVSLLGACRQKTANVNNTDTVALIISEPSAPIDSMPLRGFARLNVEDKRFSIRMAYADTANFLHQKMYPCASCYFRPEVKEALEQAAALASNQHLILVIYDCYRPARIQMQMYDKIKNPKYVSKPGKTSMHTKGQAVDLALADTLGHLLDFGSAFDEFSERSAYNFEGISNHAKANRALLRSLMLKAGFEAFESEWWHFNYKKIDYPPDNVIWNCQ